MPLELGLDLGCRRFGRAHHKEKVCLILDVEPYRYQKFISDISGQDIYAHGGDERKVIKIVRDWLRLGLDLQKVKIPGGEKIFQRYQEFQEALPILYAKFDLDPAQLPFADFSFVVATWLSENPL